MFASATNSSSSGGIQSDAPAEQAKIADNPASFWSQVRFLFFGKEVKGADPGPGQTFKKDVAEKKSSLFASIRKWCSFSWSGASSGNNDTKVRSLSFLNWFSNSKTPETNVANVPSQEKEGNVATTAANSQSNTVSQSSQVTENRGNKVRATQQKKPAIVVSANMSSAEVQGYLNQEFDKVDAEIARKRSQPSVVPALKKSSRDVSSSYAQAKPFHDVASRMMTSLENFQDKNEGNLSRDVREQIFEIDATITAWKNSVWRAVTGPSGSNRAYQKKIPSVMDALNKAISFFSPSLSGSEKPPIEEQEPNSRSIEENLEVLTSLFTKLEDLLLEASDSSGHAKAILPAASNVSKRLQSLKDDIGSRKDIPQVTQEAVKKASDAASTWKKNIQAGTFVSASKQDFMQDLDMVFDSLKVALRSLHPDLQIAENPKGEQQKIAGETPAVRENILRKNIASYTSAIDSLCTKLEGLYET